MRTGRPKKYKKSINITISMEEQKIKEIDDLRGNFSRGEYLNILTTSDNLKTKRILDLKKENEELSYLNEMLSKKDNTAINSFQKTIHSNFRKYYEEYFNKMPITSKKFWAKQLNCQTKDLINYL